MPTNEAELERCRADQRWRLFSGCLYKIMIKGDNGEEQPPTRLGGWKEFCGVKGSQLVA